MRTSFVVIVDLLNFVFMNNVPFSVFVAYSWVTILPLNDSGIGFCSSGMINRKELSLVKGKAAWMVYLVIAFSIPLNILAFSQLMVSDGYIYS